MQVALDMGTINIDNQEVATFIQNKSVDEFKILFVQTRVLVNSKDLTPSSINKTLGSDCFENYTV